MKLRLWASRASLLRAAATALASPPTSQSPNSQLLQDMHSLSSHVSSPLVPTSRQCCRTGTDFLISRTSLESWRGLCFLIPVGTAAPSWTFEVRQVPESDAQRAVGVPLMKAGITADPCECTQSPSLGTVMGPWDNLRTHMSLNKCPLIQSSTRAVGRNTQPHAVAKTWALCHLVPQSLKLPTGKTGIMTWPTSLKGHKGVQ